MMKHKLKSLGSLRIHQKTKPRSPELTGAIRIQRHTLEAIIDQMNDDDEVTANLAAWKHHDDDEFYLSIELSPKYRFDAKPTKLKTERSIFELMEQKDAE